MANSITKTGITIRSTEEIKDLIINGDENSPGLQQIFGEDAVFDSDSPDGQLVGIIAQAIRDVEEKVLQVYTSFDPDQAVGVSLDNRVLYNGLRRKGATYTITPVNITAGNTSVTIHGLNEVGEDGDNLFTVSDNLGTDFYLLSTHTIPANTTLTLSFRAKESGEVQVTPNTITRMKSVYLDITNINNPNKPFVIGVNEETDEQLRIRRAKAVGYGLLGSVEVLQNALRQLENVTDVAIFENTSDTMDMSPPTGDDGLPPHSMWIIVEGGEDQKIATTIFLRLNSACGMKQGNKRIAVESVQGFTYYITYSTPIYEPLMIRMTAEPKNERAYMNSEAFRKSLAKQLSFSIYSPASTTDIDCTAKSIQDDFSYYTINVARKADAIGYTITSNIDYNDWTSITDGVLTVDFNNGYDTLVFSNLDFSSVTSLGDIITVINNAVDANSSSISYYAVATAEDSTKIRFDCVDVGETEFVSGFLPIPKEEGTTGTDIYSLLGTLTTGYTLQESDWKEFIFPLLYQNKFTISADDIELTILNWGE